MSDQKHFITWYAKHQGTPDIESIRKQSDSHQKTKITTFRQCLTIKSMEASKILIPHPILNLTGTGNYHFTLITFHGFATFSNILKILFKNDIY